METFIKIIGMIMIGLLFIAVMIVISSLGTNLYFATHKTEYWQGYFSANRDTRVYLYRLIKECPSDVFTFASSSPETGEYVQISCDTGKGTIENFKVQEFGN